MTNRKANYIIKNQKPVCLAGRESVGEACRAMLRSGAGSVLIVDDEKALTGIFTGRDCIRLLASTDQAGTMPVERAMTARPVAGTRETRAIDALETMQEGRFRHMPIVEDGKILGVVSRNDLKGMEIAELDRIHGQAPPETGASRTLDRIIEGRRPALLGEEQTVQEACQAMSDKSIGSVVVVDGNGRLAGIFSGRDAVRALANDLDRNTKLAQVMTRKAVALSPGDHAIDALRAMCDGGFRHLPVVEGARVVGVVTRDDFSGVEIDRLDEEEHLRECIW